MTSASPLETKFDVVGLGNALVDVIAPATDAFLEEHGLHKGSMSLINADQAHRLYDAMGQGVEVSGGSAANTLAGLASFGGRSGFIGRVCDDQLGTVFAHDIRAAGVTFPISPASDGLPTGRCLIAVTPDAQRTMSTLLGAAAELGPEDVDESMVGSAAICYLEGYLFEQPAARAAFDKAATVAHDAGRKVALTLSDSFCVERSPDGFRDLVERTVDVLFGNEDELRALYETTSTDDALQHAQRWCDLIVVTRGANGSTVVAGKDRHDVAAAPVAHVVDTTGAGDLFAAGFLYGLTSGRDLSTCARLGSMAAAEVISHFGARPEVSLAMSAKLI
ncbi:MAG: adenosine kinase [Acidimicrobiales bacterium]